MNEDQQTIRGLAGVVAFLWAQVGQLQAQLAATQARITELETQRQPAKPEPPNA